MMRSSGNYRYSPADPEELTVTSDYDSSYKSRTTSISSSHKNAKRQFRMLCCGCCVCIVLIIFILAVLGYFVIIPAPETDALYFATCVAGGSSSGDTNNLVDGENDTNAMPRVGPAEERLQQPSPGTEQPDFEDYPIYQSFFETPELYHRLHVHVLFLEKGDDNTERTSFLRDTPEAVLTTRTVGSDTGSADYFDIGIYDFDPVEAYPNAAKPNHIFEWDLKGILVYKFDGTASIEFEMIDKDKLSKDDALMSFSIPISDLPEPGGDWSEILYRTSAVAPDYDELTDARLAFKVKVSTGYFVSEADMDASLSDTDEIEYREHVLTLESGDHALAQAWTHNSGTNKAVLWLPGRNDAFHHPHVADEIFFSEGKMDLYVLNYRFNGQCLKRGFLEDPYYNSHNPCGDADIYNEEINLILELITTNGPYDIVVGYGASTGATIILNYVMEHGDDSFSGFVLNSPFLDFDETVLNEFILENLPVTMANSQVVKGPAKTPEEFQNNPIMYLGKEIVPNNRWAKRIYSIYYSEWSGRVKYKVPATVGYVRSVNGVFEKMQNRDGVDITSKPVLVVTSTADTILNSMEIVELSKRIRKECMVIQYRHNGHDVFLSPDVNDTLLAVEDVKMFFAEHFYETK